MNIVHPSYEILSEINGIEFLKKIEQVGRTCYKSEDKITEDGESAKKFVKMLIDNEHHAMIEHAPTISVKFTVDRGISHELVRHRLFSFAQESTRYCNYSKDKFDNSINMIDLIGGLEYDNKFKKLDKKIIDNIVEVWYNTIESCEKGYLKMIELGCTPQIARSVLPNSTKTDIIVSGNVREWREFFKLRVAKDAHPQMREIVIPLLKDLQSKIPILFDDIEIEK